MDFWGTARVVARRWYVFVPTLVLAMLGAVAVYKTVPIQYESKAVILLGMPPTGATQYGNGYEPGTTNPLLNANNGLALTGSLLIEAMRTAEFGQKVGFPTDGSAAVTINNGTSNPELLTSGPFVFVTVDSASPERSRALVQRAVDQAGIELKARQATLNAPPVTFVTFNVIVPASEAVPQRGSRLRAAGSAGAFGVLLSLASVFAAESLFQARARRRRDASEADALLLSELSGTSSEQAQPDEHATVGAGRG
jgi:hypothetical protein